MASQRLIAAKQGWIITAKHVFNFNLLLKSPMTAYCSYQYIKLDCSDQLIYFTNEWSFGSRLRVVVDIDFLIII